MPVEISPAPELSERKLTQVLENVPGRYIIAEDIVIIGQGKTREEVEQDRNEKLKLDRRREENIKLNAETFGLRQKVTTYVGHHLMTDGIKWILKRCVPFSRCWGQQM